MSDSSVNISVSVDTSGATAGFASLNSSLNGVGANINATQSRLATLGSKLSDVGNKMKDFGKGMAVAVSVPLIAVGAGMVKLASDLNETLSKTDVVFGKNSDSVKKWGATTLKQFGIAKGTALDMASLFGDIGTSMGIPQEEMAGMAEKLTGLAGDLASFKNISLDVAKTGLNGIFTGETESLKALGVVMTEANLSSYALAEGIKKPLNKMTEAEKVQLRYNYVLEKTSNAQGDFARTQDSTANQTRIFQESLKELGATMGEKILPIITPIIHKMNELVKKFSEMPDSTQKIILAIGGLAIIIPPIIIGIGLLVGAIGGIMTAVAGAGGVMALLINPVTIAIAVIAGLIAVFVLMYQHNEQFRAKVLEVWTFVQSFISQAVTGIMTIVSVVLAVISQLWKEHGAEIMAVVNTAFSFIVAVIETVLGVIGGIIKVFAGILTGDWNKIWEGVKQIVSSVWNGIGAVISTGLSLIKSVISTGLNIVLSVISSVWGGVKNLFREPLESAGSWIANQIKYISGLFSGMKLEIPKFKLPHFSMTGKFSLNPPSIPSIGVNWYAKGGVFNSASTIGVGEAGSEAVLPLTNDRTMAMLGSKISEFMPDGGNGSGGTMINNTFQVTANVREEADVEKVGQELYKLQQRESRRLGRSGK